MTAQKPRELTPKYEPARVYVAGASSEIARAEACIRALGAGRVSFDWPAAMRAAPRGEADMTPDECADAARACLRGVDEASIVWVLLPTRGHVTSGMWAEMGYALKAADPKGTGEQRKRIIASGPRHGIFWALAHEHFSLDAEALERIRRQLGIER